MKFYSGSLSGIYSDIFSGILSGNLFDNLQYLASILTFFLASTLAFYSVLSGNLSAVCSGPGPLHSQHLKKLAKVCVCV